MSAPDDSYRTAPTRDLIDDLLDNRPEVYQRAKDELLARLANKKKERLIELVALEAKHSKPASERSWRSIVERDYERCCSDRLNSPHKADIPTAPAFVRFLT